MIRYFQEAKDRKDHYCETTDPQKATHFCLNGGFKQPIADLKYTNGGQMPPAETLTEKMEPLPLPTANYDEQEQNQSEQKPNVSNDGPLGLPTMNFEQKKQQKKQGQKPIVTDDDEPLGLPTL